MQQPRGDERGNNCVNHDYGKGGQAIWSMWHPFRGQLKLIHFDTWRV